MFWPDRFSYSEHSTGSWLSHKTCKENLPGQKIAEKIENNATTDWKIRESARAKLMVRWLEGTLTKHGYPPDKQQAIDMVLKPQSCSLNIGCSYNKPNGDGARSNNKTATL